MTNAPSTSNNPPPDKMAEIVVPHLDDENVSDALFFGTIPRPTKTIAELVEKLRPWVILAGITLMIPIVAVVWIDLMAEPKLVVKNSLIYIAKIVFIYIALGAAGGCAAVLFNYRELIFTLRQTEELINVLRDEAVYQLESMRIMLEDVKRKLFPPEDQVEANVADLVKSALPVVMALINKEKNVLKWGMFGLKVAREAMDFFKGTSKDKG